MSIATLIASIEVSRNTIRNKLVELGLAQSSDKLEKLAGSVGNITNQGAVSATVKEGDTYTIPKGYHNGSGTVSGVSGGGSYNLQSKTATPTKSQQNITPDSGYFGLSDVTINPIPENYNDTSGVTAAEADVLAGKIIVGADGSVKAGQMVNNGAISASFDGLSNDTYTIPKGYHSGTGKVSLTSDIENALAAI